MISFDQLQAARVALDETAAKARALLEEKAKAEAERKTADADLSRLLGLERLGEGDAGAIKVARKRANEAGAAIESIGAAATLIDERLAAAQAAIEEAKSAFRWDARDRIQPEYERLRDKLHDQALALAITLRHFVRVDAVAKAIERGVRTGADLFRSAGDPLEIIRREEGVELTASFVSTPARLTPDEIARIVDGREQPAAEAAQ